MHSEIKIAVQLALTRRKYITPGPAENLADLLQDQSKNDPYDLLSNRELEIFRALAKGATTAEISKFLAIAPTTVSTYHSRVMEKLNLYTNADLTMYAVENHLI